MTRSTIERVSRLSDRNASRNKYLRRVRKPCSQIVNTNSQIGTVQDSYLTLSYLVKSHLAALPSPATPPNSFPFCTRAPSTSRREFRSSFFDFRVSPFEFRVSSLTPLSTAFLPRAKPRGYAESHANSFIYRFYAESPANPFIYRIYAKRPGCGGPEPLWMPPRRYGDRFLTPLF